MNLKKILSVLVVAVTLLTGTIACKSKISDADLKAKVETAVQSNPNVIVEVKDGVVTLNGTVSSDDEKAKLESAAKAADAKGVKSVVNNLVVNSIPLEPIQVNTNDADLQGKVATFTKDFPTVKTTVVDGVITVTGELEQARIQALKMGLDALNPKKVDMSGIKIK
ncbi:BON domain-containing protein [Sphingobacterium sp. DK4209]|uniref:BON domain-containing protein n=1 Tax=Sphingobacterium zhuxiongii TaxID=2662364 RepID=A0A5Q0QAC5_9SPHI|nr:MULTISPECIES: BON domain-containing protein [unclassified Sphingobacterium]MVZ66853.1 BON domain-containing protein [Sphingobacterium sp. DK4209]QGA26224.1 BON domain-containing protein [Sphingobacterium sp. dk4302]